MQKPHFHKLAAKLKRAFLFASHEENRPALRCVELCTGTDGEPQLVATDGTRLVMVRLVADDLKGLDWDGKNCKLPPSVTFLVTAMVDKPLLVRDSVVTVGGVDALAKTFADERFPDFRRVVPALDEQRFSLAINGVEFAKRLAALPRFVPPVEARVAWIVNMMRQPNLAVKLTKERAFCDVYPQRMALRYSRPELVPVDVKDLTLGYEWASPPYLVDQEDGECWPTARICCLNLQYVKQAVGACTTATMHTFDQFGAALVLAGDETHVIMPMRA